MKKQGLQGAGRVLRFTLRRQLGEKGWWFATLFPMLLLLLGIPAALLLANNARSQEPQATPITRIVVVDETPAAADYSVLNALGDVVFSGLRYEKAADLESGKAAAASSDTTLLLQVRLEAEYYRLRLIRPLETALTGKDAQQYAAFLERSFAAVSVQKAELPPALLVELATPVQTETSTTQAFRQGEERSGYELFREVLEIALPFLCIIILYFMVLLYGQGIAGLVVLEKSNKLMDTMLLSLQPKAMILGKTLSGAISGSIQLCCWILGCLLGCAAGRVLLLQVNPACDMGVIQFFALVEQGAGMFSTARVCLAVLILLAGFFMYCAIFSIGGALASRTEDLGSSNSIFTLLLVASYLLTLFGGEGGVASGAMWMDILPFTAVLSTPARMLLGQVSIPMGILSLALILAVMLGAVLLAGKLYSMLTFHRGDPPKLKDIPRILRTGG